MEQNFTTDYMKKKEKERLFKGIVSILTGFMLVLIAIFPMVSFFFYYISCALVIAGVICFVAGIFVIKKVLLDD